MKILKKMGFISLLIVSLSIYFLLGYSWITFLIYFLVPDLFSVGYIWNNKLGAIIYNIGHTLIIPALLLLIDVLFHINGLTQIVIIWFFHIFMDRSLGYGLKYEDGFTHTSWF
ncbi:DUF4260 family protein [Apilactobacillus timberlakei]|uniref:DUF4260 family protein n=1 Tax=Apilactobacillus timberlakei TaxID=2008380 RepID=UPI00112D154A|nr:DUF4260 family protein [Apilactobacillus timberlakei]TPR19292.1 DUF4260 family protein [Apilactobacillus timberlakei]